MNHSGQWDEKPGVMYGLDFSEGLANLVSKRGVQVIDGSMSVILEAEYQDAGIWAEGVCRMLDGDHWVYVRRSGKVEVDAVHFTHHQPQKSLHINDCEDFVDGVARVHCGGAFEIEDDGPAYWGGGAWYYIDRKGVVISLCRRDSDFGVPYGKENW